LKTEIIKLNADREAALEGVMRRLREDKVVSFPTETVYALASRRTAEAVHALQELKGRDPSKPFACLVGSPEILYGLVGEIPSSARRILLRCTPGPLTLVFLQEGGGSIGVRIPSHPFALELVKCLSEPILATSANPSGKPPAVTAEEVLAYFDGKVPFVVDGGRCQYGKPSTVIGFEGERWSVLREGAISEAMLRRCANFTVLFVCAGNTCRSPIAEQICRRFLAERLKVEPGELEAHGYSVLSAGISASLGARASELARRAAESKGIDLKEHLAQRLSPEMVKAADRVFVLERSQLFEVRRMLEENGDKINLLDPDGADIPDPMGADIKEYLACAEKIERAIRKRIDEL